MDGLNVTKVKLLVLVIFSVFFISFIVISNEARKEIYYLCGNFGKGDSLSNVTRQLNTVNLSNYQAYRVGANKKIVHSSLFNFHVFKCTINFDTDEKVTSAVYSG
ncbi:hypothetical protein GCM10009114_13770 [Aliiglaciecola litoralis]|uniref:Uncharacterized protein n=1 Tax=Aliiglaciecola litoralis TaxID=582857 RepID=A0ABN1LFG5_9ALTE